MITEFATIIGGIFLGSLCGRIVNRLTHIYDAQAQLALLWASVMGGVVTFSLARSFGISPEFWTYTAIFFVLGIAAGIDFLIYVLPDIITVGGTVVAFPLAVLLLGLTWQQTVAGCMVGALSLGGLYFVSLKSMDTRVSA